MGDFLELIAAHTWAGYVFGIVLATLIARYVAKRFFDRLERQAEKTHNLYDDAVLFAARKPVGWAIYVVGIAWAADIAGGQSGAEIFNYIGVVRGIGRDRADRLVRAAVRVVHGEEHRRSDVRGEGGAPDGCDHPRR